MLWLLLLWLILGSSEHVDEISPTVHELIRILGNILGNISEEILESSVHVSSVAGSVSSSVLISILFVLHNNEDRLNGLGWILNLEEGVIVFEFSLTGFAVIEVLTD